MSLAEAVMAQEDRLEAECHALLHRYVFNCGCTTQFLEDQLGADEADILLKLWAYGVNADNDRNEVYNLHLQYGSKKVFDAVMNFQHHRDLLRGYCAQGDGPTIAD